MTRYITRRVLIIIPFYFFVTLVVFLLISSTPGDPVVQIVGIDGLNRLSAAQLQRIRSQYGFDKPLYVRYFIWLRNAVQGDLGLSYGGQRPVLDDLAQRTGPTLLLMATGLLLSILIGVPLGILMALRRGSVLDYIITVLTFVNYSIPTFFLGMSLVYLLALRLPIFPVGGMLNYSEPFSLGDLLKHLALPAFTLAAFNAGVWARYTKNSVLEVLSLDYVTVARSKGLKERVVILRHALRNGLLPLVTLMGLYVPQLVGGSVIVETIFNWPGLGILGYRAALARDYPAIMGLLLLTAAIILLANLITDIAYAFVDPRIVYS